MTDTIFRVHPTINFARVGSSKEYYIAPETAAGELVDKQTGLFGGLPIKTGTEDTVIEATDLRDKNQNLLRQAARFRIFAYDQEQKQYPSNDPGREVKIGDNVNGKTIKDILWMVHAANKKGNNYSITNTEGEEEGIVSYEHGNTPPIRNPSFGKDLALVERRQKLVIDPGPRVIKASSGGTETLAFNATTPSTYLNDSGQIEGQANYPVSFPSDHFTLLNPLGDIDTLGEITIEKGTGRLIFIGAYGKTSCIKTDGKPASLSDPIDNNGWFDDTSDGPVDAVIVFGDATTASVVGGWVVTTDPGYAPQTRNVVSTWDDAYSTWIENLGLIPGMYSAGKYNNSFKASFDSDVLSVFHGAFLQRWNTNLPSGGIKGHDYIMSIKPSDDPKKKIPDFKSLIRDPNIAAENDEGVKMPLALGDAMKSFLSVTPTQYFLLNQWYAGQSVDAAVALGAGEKLDKVVLENCLGGRYSPGIDLTFIVRDVNFYKQNWKGVIGPFRVNGQKLNYATAQKDQPFLQVGYIPLRTAAVEPGDLCKFMSLPWHTDYNSCATHEPDPNPSENNTLYWSWPAQRPVNVYPADKCTYDAASKTWSLGGQLFSLRGKGTHSDYPQQEGRYQCYFDFVENWHKVGFVIQGIQVPATEGGNYGADKFVEVASLFDDDGDIVQPWPTASLPGYQTPDDCGPK